MKVYEMKRESDATWVHEPNGLIVQGELTLEEWSEIGREIVGAQQDLIATVANKQSAIMWALGDWLRYGHGRYERGQYETAVKETGYSTETLRKAKQVAGVYESGRRLPLLSWNHHKSAASLPEETRSQVLDQAAAEGWSVRKMRVVAKLIGHGETVDEATLVEVPDVSPVVELTEYAGGEKQAAKEQGQQDRRLMDRDRRKRLEAPSLAEVGKYDVIYADPPWRYRWPVSENRAVENHYPTMTHEEICKLDVGSIAADNSVLYLWATAPKLVESLEVMKSWGFEYRTHAIWDKVDIGMGYWYRGRHELLLVGVRGDPPTPAPEFRRPSVYTIKKGRHSEKPGCIAEDIVSSWPGAKRIELFARDSRENWDVWGNEISARSGEVPGDG